MANRAVSHGVNVVFFLQSLAQLNGIFADILGLPIQFGDVLDRAQVRFGISVAVDTPSHGLVFGLVNDLHLVNSSVARNT